MPIRIKNRIKITIPSPKIRWAIFLAITLLALFIRLAQLGERPMHTDEAVNAYITGQLLAGEKYHYDPQDRHGPVLSLLAKPVVQLCGANNLADLTENELRLTPVLVGSATVLLFGAAVEMLGFLPCVVAALLFAVGPLPVYYSRYFIHETIFVAATFGLLLAGARAVKNNSLAAAALAGLCAALMLACKETAVLHFFALGVAAGTTWILTRTRRDSFSPAPQRGEGWGEEAGNLNIETLHASPLPAWAGRGSQSRPPITPLKILAIAGATFLLAFVLLFTGFGQDWAALANLFHAIPNFAQRAGGQGHAQPFTYYVGILDPLFIFLIVAAAGIYAVICDGVAGTRRAGLVLAVYALGIFLIYSAIPYKTPWLALNLWLPMTLLCGLGVEGVCLQFTSTAGRWIAGVGVALLVLAAGQQTKTLAFDFPADEKNPLAYAHTTGDILNLPARLTEICRARKLSAPRIAVVMKDAWPLPWYLRKFPNTGYWQPGQATGAADFYITPTDIDAQLAVTLRDFRPEFFGVRPNVLLILWLPPAPPAP